MTKKRIDIGKVASELQGSVFFQPPAKEPGEALANPETSGHPDGVTARRRDAATAGRQDGTTPRRQGSGPSRRRGAPPDGAGDRVTTLGRAVQELGIKRTTIRFSRPEKAALREIVHTYDRREIRTTENELTRIAVNWLVEDYHELGESSVLAQVVAQLQARPREE